MYVSSQRVTCHQWVGHGIMCFYSMLFGYVLVANVFLFSLWPFLLSTFYWCLRFHLLLHVLRNKFKNFRALASFVVFILNSFSSRASNFSYFLLLLGYQGVFLFSFTCDEGALLLPLFPFFPYY